MQRHEMIEAFAQLGLKGMAGTFDETVTTGLQRGRTAMGILADLLKAETAYRQAASIRYRLSTAKLPVMKDLAAFSFESSPINEGLVRTLHDGSFLPNHRNIVLVGGTGTGKTHLAIAITANVGRAGARRGAPGRVAATSTPSIWSTSWRTRPTAARPAPCHPAVPP